MEKEYKKFYEVRNNRYYVLYADEDYYIATETFIGTKSRRFRKPRTLTQGLKLLKMSIPMTILFSKIIDMEVNGEVHDIPTYELFDGKDINDLIKAMYNSSVESTIFEIENWYNSIIDELEQTKTKEEMKELKKVYKERKEDAIRVAKENADPTLIVKKPTYGTFPVIDKMLYGGLNFLYSERLTGFVTEHYLYSLDKFGTLTVYRVTTVIDEVKSIDTFIYDVNVIKELMNYLEKEN